PCVRLAVCRSCEEVAGEAATSCALPAPQPLFCIGSASLPRAERASHPGVQRVGRMGSRQLGSCALPTVVAIVRRFQPEVGRYDRRCVRGAKGRTHKPRYPDRKDRGESECSRFGCFPSGSRRKPDKSGVGDRGTRPCSLLCRDIWILAWKFCTSGSSAEYTA